MKERPILFSGPLVRAILRDVDPKTMTRRLVKPRPDGQPVCDPGDAKWYVDGGIWCRACPFGVPGDRLWVRETHAQAGTGRVFYRADEGTAAPRWTPAIHMPRALSRIDLEVTAVRVEQLNEIPDADIPREGLDVAPDADPYSEASLRARNAWRELWDSINGKRPGASWASNPWVWVVSFKRVRP